MSVASVSQHVYRWCFVAWPLGGNDVDQEVGHRQENDNRYVPLDWSKTSVLLLTGNRIPVPAFD